MCVNDKRHNALKKYDLWSIPIHQDHVTAPVVTLFSPDRRVHAANTRRACSRLIVPVSTESCKCPYMMNPAWELNEMDYAAEVRFDSITVSCLSRPDCAGDSLHTSPLFVILFESFSIHLLIL